MLKIYKKALVAMLGAALSAWPLVCRGQVTDPDSERGWAAARKAEDQGDYPTMVHILRPLAEKGDVGAQYYVGLMYNTGQVGKKDNAEAAKWYRKAAEQGNARAQYYLASIYYEDDSLRDYAEAMKWFTTAADQGTAMAQYSLGMMYAKGQGTEKDFVQAYKWFSLSSSALPAAARAQKQGALKARDAAAGKLTPEQKAEAEELVGKWKQTEEKRLKVGGVVK
jgi:TPR repeat protein